jgi:glycosyltransferase involved in cell wall biosynthesis
MKSNKLYIIIPAYNEDANIRDVVFEWNDIIVRIGPESRLVIIDDGSKDSTYKILTELSNELPQLIPLTKKNSGHGATVLFGYNYALQNKVDYVFQTDSDRQTLPEEFWQFWEQRQQFDILIGNRVKRQDGLSRIFITTILKLVLYIIFGVYITDSNTPFRLMKYNILKKYITKIPENFFLSNIVLTVFFVKCKENYKFIPITFRTRQGGINSINIKKILKIGILAFKDFMMIKKANKELRLYPGHLYNEKL